jgi:hypothetical protein
VEQEQLTFPKHLSLPQIVIGILVAQSLVFCVVVCRSLLLFFVVVFFFCLFFWLLIWYLPTFLKESIQILCNYMYMQYMTNHLVESLHWHDCQFFLSCYQTAMIWKYKRTNIIFYQSNTPYIRFVEPHMYLNVNIYMHGSVK